MKTLHVATGLSRREFLGTAAAMLAATCPAGRCLADDRPPVTNPRATSGDDAFEPNWKERLTVTVGPAKADLVGKTDKVIQAAVDYVARLRGGTVRILPGTYRMHNAVYLRSGVRIVGSGADSVLFKVPSVSTRLAADSDWYDREITLVDPRGFEVGDGVCLRGKGRKTLRRTLVARSGNRFKLDRAPRENFWLKDDATASTLFPLFDGDHVSDVVIENLAFDGNRDNNENLNGNYGGSIFLQDCSRISMRRLALHHYNGDGISWQICHDVVVEQCHSHDNAGLGLHPGSGSKRPLIRDNRLERNNIGLYFCWGVTHGLAEQNVIDANRSYGISIGHCDTDNLICNNQITRSGKVGVLFRGDPKAFAAHRNRLEKNRIVDSGPEDGIAVDVRGQSEGVVIGHNEIRETRGPARRIGIRIGADTKAIQLIDNRIEGFAETIKDLRR